MKKQVTLKFKLLGDFGYMTEGEESWHSINEINDSGVGKKQRAFLTYLLLNHKRKITSTELMDCFWSDEGKCPANSLKNTMHKTRALLQAMFPQCEELILTQSGGYVWNKDITIWLDTEAFECTYQKAKENISENRIVWEEEAVSLYKGEILPDLSLSWLESLNVYYRSMFIDVCKALVVHLQEEERWEKLLSTSSYAYSISPEVEEFTIGVMRALAITGDPGLAMKHYEEYRAMLWQEFGLVPSEVVEQVYTMVTEYKSHMSDYDEELIYNQLAQVPEDPKAFQCSLLVFRNVVQLELRNMLRNSHESSLVIIGGEKTNNSQISTDIRRLERTLLYGLRAGDPFTRLNQGEYVLLLSGASHANAQKVVDRVIRRFYATYPRSSAKLNYRIFPLKTEK